MYHLPPPCASTAVPSLLPRPLCRAGQQALQITRFMSQYLYVDHMAKCKSILVTHKHSRVTFLLICFWIFKKFPLEYLQIDSHFFPEIIRKKKQSLGIKKRDRVVSREVEVFCSAAAGDMKKVSAGWTGISLWFSSIYKTGARMCIKDAHLVCSGEELP